MAWIVQCFYCSNLFLLLKKVAYKISKVVKLGLKTLHFNYIKTAAVECFTAFKYFLKIKSFDLVILLFSPRKARKSIDGEIEMCELCHTFEINSHKM